MTRVPDLFPQRRRVQIDAFLCARERSELERQGAKSAARGDSLRANPMLAPWNAAAATGESHATWLARHNAWRAGFEVQTGVEALNLL